jgi:type IV pilus assembly protein PilV
VRSRLGGGFTLIEVLVAIVVLAVAIVGAAGAQLAALRTRQASALLSNGVQLAGAMAERMRANAEQMRAPDSANPYLQLRYDAALDGPPGAVPPCYAGAACASVQLAAFDIAELKQALHAQFPGGRVAVCRDAVLWNPARAALDWQCRGASGPIVIKLGWHARLPDGSKAQDDAGQYPPQLAIVVAQGPQ